MSFRLKEDHLITMIQFMESYPEFATGRLSVANAKEKFKKLWQELSTQLNSLGYGVRPVEKWQKTWTDYKTNLKKKASEIKKHQGGTGGGPELKKKLSDIELRVLAILGKTFYEGCGVQEQGLRVETLGSSSGAVVETESSSNKWQPFQCESNKPFTAAGQLQCGRVEPHLSSSTGVQLKRNEEKNKAYEKDHDYLLSPPTKSTPMRKRKNDIESLYMETIKNLEAIEGTLSNMGTRLESLENVVAQKLDAINETISNGFLSVNQTLQEFLDKF